MKTPYILNIGDIPTVFISKSSKKEIVLFELIGNAIDSGRVFFEFLPTDIWGTIEKKKENFLLLKRDDCILVRCKLSESNLTLIEDKGGILLIISDTPHHFRNYDKVHSLDDIDKWISEEEKRLQLNEGEIGAILIGVWNDKPFN